MVVFSIEKKKMNCVVCSNKALYLCGQCKTQPYCGESCQYQDALMHLENCFIEGRSYDDNVKRQRASAKQKEALIELTIQAVSQGDYAQVKDNIQTFNVTDLNRIIEYARTHEMARILVDAGANIYTVINQRRHTLALDELSKYFSIRPFLIEADEETPSLVKKLVDAIDTHPFKESDKPMSKVFTLGDLRKEYDWWEELDWYTVRHMIYNGFFPYFNRDYAEGPFFVESLFFRRYNEATLTFWLSNFTLKDVLSSISAFKWSNMAALQENSERSPYSFSLILFAPHLVYMESRRAKTTMSKFVIPGKSIVIYNRPDENEFIPVTRYAEGMSKSFYFEDTSDIQKNSYCGTFYYYEPESTTFLHVNPQKILRAIDKSDAAKKLGVLESFVRVFEVLFLDYNLLVSKKYWDLWSGHPRDPNVPSDVSEFDVFYSAYKQEAYALQDDLDQPFCNAAREQGYDVIILDKMVGSRQIVTEILDTRPREESFGNLCFLKDVSELVRNDQTREVSEAVKSLSPDQLNKLIALTVSVEMARILVNAGADVYTYIGNGQVALDEMVKHFSILEFLEEAKEPTPDIVKKMIAHVKG